MRFPQQYILHKDVSLEQVVGQLVLAASLPRGFYRWPCYWSRKLSYINNWITLGLPQRLLFPMDSESRNIETIKAKATLSELEPNTILDQLASVWQSRKDKFSIVTCIKPLRFCNKHSLDKQQSIQSNMHILNKLHENQSRWSRWQKTRLWRLKDFIIYCI